MKGKSNYERVILTLLALVAIIGSGWMIFKTLGFADTLQTETVPPRKELGDVPLKNVADAINRAVTPTKPWTAPIRSNKPVPLNKSVLLVLKDEVIVDLFVDDPMLRPPMTNAFLRENSLPNFTSPNVGELDADRDGFTNLEEFLGNTKPKDARSHPAVTEKLFLVNRISHDYRITLKASSAPFQVATPDDRTKKNWFVEEGKNFGAGGRFKAIKFEKKVIPDPTIGERDVSELTCEDTVRGNSIVVLVKDVITNIADYEGEFEFRLKVLSRWKANKGGTFRIPGYDDVTYKVIDIEEDKAVISPLSADGTPGKEILIKKN